MPQKNQKTVTPFNGYVQLSLNEGDENAIVADNITFGDCLVKLADIAQNGYRLTIMPKTEEPGYKTTLQDILDQRGSYGWMLSGEGPDMRLACIVLLYKFAVLAGGDLTPFCGQTRKAKGLR